MQDEIENKIHPFERTLGLGPYKLAGFFAMILPSEANQGRNNFHLAPKVVRGMGTCAHCGHAILNVFIVQIGNGECYGVGSDCIEKAGLPYSERIKFQKLERERLRVQRQERKAKKGKEARDKVISLILEHSVIMKNIKHPRRDVGSLFDYAEWIAKNANDGGIVIALKMIQKEIEKSLQS